MSTPFETRPPSRLPPYPPQPPPPNLSAHYPPPEPRPSTTTTNSSSSTKKLGSKQKRPSFSGSEIHNPSDSTKIRAYSACRNCRLKKTKCLPTSSSAATAGSSDGLQPGTCQQCLQAGLECVYPPSRDRAAYSRQYVANLEQRVQALEAMQSRMLPVLEVFESQRGGGADTKLAAIPTVQASNSASRARMEREKDGPGAGSGSGEMDRTNSSESEGEEREAEDDSAVRTSDIEDAGQMTQDERGNYRWIGSSNTLSLLDSFSRGDRPHDALERPPLPTHANSHHSSHHNSDPKSSRQSPAPGSDNTPRDPNPYFGPVAGSGVVKALPSIDEVQYPSPKDAMQMVDAFFEQVHPCLPIVIEHEFRKDFKKLLEARAKGDYNWGGGFISVVFGVFALGERVVVTSRAWQRERTKLNNEEATDDDTVLPGEAEAGVIWYERAQILHYTTLKDVNIHQVQCLTLMAAFQASVNAMPMSWLLAGQALRVAQDLGLHRSTARLRIPFAEKQLRARCWWAIYGLERMMSISLGRPLGVDDLDIDVGYPAEIDDEGIRQLVQDDAASINLEGVEEPVGSTMSGFVALTKLCKVAGRVVHLLYRPSNGRSVSDPSWALSQQNAINKLDKLLRDWLENDVPKKYKEASPARSVSIVSAILSNSYFTILITLHRNFLPSNPDYPRPKPPPSSQSLAHCVDAARSVIHIASQSRTLIPPSHHLAVYCQYLWSSAVILLLCEVQARDQVVIETVGTHVEACRRSLQALEPVWPGARKLKDLLNDAAARARDVVAVKQNPRTVVGKKRKSTPGDHPVRGLVLQPTSQRSPMAPPTSHGPRGSHSTSSSPSPAVPQGGNGQQWQSYSNPANSEKRQRLYETSDTRTLVGADDITPTQQYPPYYSAVSRDVTSTQTGGIPPIVPSGQYTPTAAMPTYDMTFDLGGVTFDGLELLQGFGDGASNFWNNITFTGDGTATYPPMQNTSAQGQVFSGQNTPNSASGSGPSPSSWQAQTQVQATSTSGQVQQQQQQPQQQQQYGGVQQTGDIDQFADFWGQVAGNTFDWQADPSVPFNI
ncbi:hypothetical protein CI109_104003 [Kwoniella shandongensis]|uniref:Uncharacterized protein n=1 Tax=Kwoniella shandongensis TaxID=1734106 RepID=A0A5M6BXX1_9TREE|nr:uncharacterized protein CI109_004112 [Kwoniella shandongensis]KAA5527573.1 hypothetical protein CI109_004112 [Kwoniella shandongensis]